MRIWLLIALFATSAQAADCLPFRKLIVGHAQVQYGLSAPIPMFVAQIQQESDCRPTITAWDSGRGLAQFMDSTADQVSKLFPELGPSDPYNPGWAIPAMIRYDGWLNARVQGATECDKWAAALKSYNAGLGYVKRAQAKSSMPGVWFNATEWVESGQSAKNFEYSRLYPHWILEKRQPQFSTWGHHVC